MICRLKISLDTFKSARRYLQSTANGPLLHPLTLHSSSPLIRPHHPPSTPALAQDGDFLFYPSYLSEEEQEVLVGLGLWKLARGDGISKRRRRRDRKTLDKEGQVERVEGKGLQRLFTGEYGFEEGHYDSVIHHYRETLFSVLPPSPSPLLISTLAKLYRIFPLLPSPLPETPSESDIPPAGTITHFLHLAPEGEILPHVDNLGASGKVILGVSLGGERTMRLARKAGEGKDGWDVRLPSGSVYVQRDSVRFQYEHSILRYDDEASVWDGKSLERGHRISIMVRDAPSKPAGLGGS